MSNWAGEVYHVTVDGNKTLLLDTKEEKKSAADIEIIQEKKLVLVPTFYGNTVAAYQLN